MSKSKLIVQIVSCHLNCQTVGNTFFKLDDSQGTSLFLNACERNNLLVSLAIERAGHLRAIPSLIIAILKKSADFEALNNQN